MKKTNKTRSRLIALSLLCFAFSCSRNNSSPGSGSANNGTFTATVNGKSFSNTGTSSGAILIVAADPGGGTQGDIFITLNGKSDSLSMHVKDQVGTDTLDINVYYGVYNGLPVPYLFSPVIVHVTSLTNNRIAGDFSGQAVPDNDPNGTPIQITGGIFDVPLLKP